MSLARFVGASIAVSLTGAIPASAEEPILLHDLGWFHFGVVEISRKPDGQVIFMGGVPIRVDSSRGYEVEQTYVLQQAENDTRPHWFNRHQFFCSCGGSF